MKRLIAYVLLFSSLVFIVPFAQSAETPEMTGQEIMDEVGRRHDSAYEYEEQEMVLLDRKGNKEVRTLRRYAREMGDSELYRYLIVFDSPAGVEGVALLTWQKDDDDDDQWLYLPAYGNEMKRSASGSKRNYFMGTDFAMEDLTSAPKGRFVYTRKENVSNDGVEYMVVEAVPANTEVERTSGYKYRQLFVRTDNFFIERVDYFDRRGRFFKRQTSHKLKQVQGEMWRADAIVMDNKKMRHKTLVQVKKRDFSDSSVPAKVFQQRFITTGQHMNQ